MALDTDGPPGVLQPEAAALLSAPGALRLPSRSENVTIGESNSGATKSRAGQSFPVRLTCRGRVGGALEQRRRGRQARRGREQRPRTRSRWRSEGP